MDTDRAHLQQPSDELNAILRLLPPVSSDPNSLDIYSRFYNPVISDAELPHLGIRFHHLDIENGNTSPPTIPCFLPKTNLPVVSEFIQPDHLYNEVFQAAYEEAAKPERSRGIFKGTLNIFPDSLMLAFYNFSFEGSEDLRRKFTNYHPERRQYNRYGWVHAFENFKRASDSMNDRCKDEEFRALKMDNQSYLWAMAEVGTCGDTPRLSRDEVAALECAMLDAMLSADDERPRNDNNIFPTMLIVFDMYGHSRVINGYFDGQLNIQFTHTLDFKEYAVVPPNGISYLESIDKGKFYDMINILLKWSWPIPVSIKDKDDSVILDLPTEVHPDLEVVDDGWLLV